jgi:hypothetical protein
LAAEPLELTDRPVCARRRNNLHLRRRALLESQISAAGTYLALLKSPSPLKTIAQVMPLPVLVMDLLFASIETITRRSWMIVCGECSLDEYNRMITEKTDALHQSGQAIASGGTLSDCLKPWYVGAMENAERLRANAAP